MDKEQFNIYLYKRLKGFNIKFNLLLDEIRLIKKELQDEVKKKGI